jgi:hypothetical protein
MSEARGYEIEARDSALGGGWQLRLLEDGEEVGGGVFPLAEYLSDADGDLVLALDLARADAEAEGEAWIEAHRPPPPTPDDQDDDAPR